jgi:hypothetical protein
MREETGRKHQKVRNKEERESRRKRRESEGGETEEG